MSDEPQNPPTPEDEQPAESSDGGQHGLTFLTISEIDIPPLLYSVEKDMPFQRCLHCDKDLFGGSDLYLIEKVVRGTETIIELAICLDCRQGKSEQGMSEDSMTALKGYFTGVNIIANQMESIRGEPMDTIDPWLARCAISKRPRDELREYQIVAACEGDQVQLGWFPMLLSGHVIEEISELLSDETRGWMDDYVGDNFGMPSEFCEPPSYSPMLM